MPHDPSNSERNCMTICRFEDGVKLVKIRGESMQAAADACPSGMVSVIGLDSDKARYLTGLLLSYRPLTVAWNLMTVLESIVYSSLAALCKQRVLRWTA